MDVVIIGNGIAGNAAAQAALRHPETRITLVDRSTIPFHSACVLPDYIADSLPSDVVIMKPVSSRRFKRILGEEIKAIDTVEQEIVSEKKTIPYDKLILATGSRPVSPQFPSGIAWKFLFEAFGGCRSHPTIPGQKSLGGRIRAYRIGGRSCPKKTRQSVTVIENQDRLGPEFSIPGSYLCAKDPGGVWTQVWFKGIRY